jgi:hypothetical protein
VAEVGVAEDHPRAERGQPARRQRERLGVPVQAEQPGLGRPLEQGGRVSGQANRPVDDPAAGGHRAEPRHHLVLHDGLVQVAHNPSSESRRAFSSKLTQARW